ncbi:MAG TPA: helix-turn-helix transcriptional regulator [Chryseolinea sp.]|nr:helix-turn-helix transcriptional regulator [Chryseolinea sp.]HPH46700.1 helix-turn-helix transcriptional regulator [Chryseolinea sp.]HPM28794.1 helix-turn-helix transcriptional regulator [Chryseolinea sp.]
MKKYALITSKGQASIEGLVLGQDYILSRPFDWNELQGWIQKLMNNPIKQHEFNVLEDYRPKKTIAISTDELLRQRIVKVAEENITNTNFSVTVFAKEVGMSTAQLYRKLVELTGYAPNDFMRHMRLQRAADLLKQRAGNVSEIGYQTGFNNLSYFSKRFKEKFGRHPSSFLGSVVAT